MEKKRALAEKVLNYWFAVEFLSQDKYPDKLKVYTIGDFDKPVSREVCGGPHVEHTGVIGKFKIKKEESSSAGVRRIKAILE